MSTSPQSLLSAAAARLARRENGRPMPEGGVSVGVDLGTANVVLTVLDSAGPSPFSADRRRSCATDWWWTSSARPTSCAS